MKKNMTSGLLLGALMMLSSGTAQWLTPTHKLADSRPALVLESAIPRAFGDWREDRNQVGAVVNPQTEAALHKIYSQTLSRTYVNGRGERIMLSIAYGGDQRDAVQLHYPEICYPAQGFQLTGAALGVLATGRGTVPVKRLETNLGGQRYEPITYWTTVGDIAVTGGVDKKLAEIRYGLRGQIPDGLLFRISSISQDSPAAYGMQADFAKQMLEVLSPALRLRLFGLRG
jgi:EpsI family protein